MSDRCTKCHSFAINNDPDEKLCDVCDAYVRGAEAMRERAALFCEGNARTMKSRELAAAIRKLEVKP